MIAGSTQNANRELCLIVWVKEGCSEYFVVVGTLPQGQQATPGAHAPANGHVHTANVHHIPDADVYFDNGAFQMFEPVASVLNSVY